MSCQTTVLGLGQLVREHPELRERYLPGIRACTDWLITPEARAFGVGRWGEDALADLEPTGTHAYLGYILSALSMHRSLEPDVPWSALHDRLIARMRAAIARPPHAIETYPGETYPADISTVLAGLALAGVDVATEARALRDAARDPATGLWGQTLHAGGRGEPRGSGTAFSSYFLGYVDRDVSAEACDALIDARVAGLWGIREYPVGVEGWGDVDRGPVVLGLGVSATGFALASARMHGRRERFVRLHRTAGLFGLPLPGPTGRWYWTGGSIGNGLLLAMITAPRLER